MVEQRESLRILVVVDDADYAEWIELALNGIGITDITMVPDGAVAQKLTETDPTRVPPGGPPRHMVPPPTRTPSLH